MRKIVYIITGLFIALVFTNTVSAQNVLDGVYVKEHSPTRKVIPYTHLREADVMWSKRIWRKLDLREKINQPLYFPVDRIKDRRSLTQVIMEAVKEGSLTAYNALDDEFTMMLTKAEIDKMSSEIDTIYTENLDPPYDMQMKIVVKDFNEADVKEYRIKEDWFFDKQRSVQDVRIIGICPVVEKFDDQGESKGPQPLFWIYFPEARNIFASAEVFNRSNDAERRTLEDIFWKRMFGSYVYKEQNVYDRKIDSYKQGIHALLEAERVKDDLFIIEHDLWEY